MSIDPRYTVTFGQSIVLNSSAPEDTPPSNIGNPGELRYNKYLDRLQVFHRNMDFIGPSEHWHQLESEIATTSNLGVIKVGNNLTITSDGLLSSIATGVSRIYQNVITIASSNSGAADYNTIEFAIDNALGSYAAGYSNGTITALNGAPSETNRYVLLCSPGYYYPTKQIILPPYTSLEGDDKNNTVIYFYTSNIDTYTDKNCIETTNIGGISGGNTFKNLTFTLELNSNANNFYNIIQNQSAGTRQNYNFDNIIINDTTTLTTPYTTNSQFVGVSVFNGSNISITNSEVNFTNTQCVAINLLNDYDIDINNTQIKCSILPDTNISTTQTLLGINANFCDNIRLDNSYINITDNSSNSSFINSTLIASNIGNCEYIDITSSTLETICNSSQKILSNVSAINIWTFAPVLPASITDCEVSIVRDNTANIYICNIDSIVPDDLTDGNATILFRGFTGVNYTGNNTYFKISGGNSSALVFDANSFQPILTTSPVGSIDIYKLRQININNSVLKSTKYLINESIDSSISPLDYPPVIISGGANVFKSGVINTPSYITTFNYPSIINISNDASSTFQTISQALEYITDASINRRYIIQIQPGIYYESAPIICKTYVNIIAIDPKNTTIYISNNASGAIQQSGFQLASNIHLSGLNIIATSTYNSLARNYNLFNADNITNVTLKDCTVLLNVNCTALAIGAINTGYVLNSNASINVKLDNVLMEIQPLNSTSITEGVLTNTQFFVINASNNSTMDIKNTNAINNVYYTNFSSSLSNITRNAYLGVINNKLSNITIHASYLAECINVSNGADLTNYYGIHLNTAGSSSNCNIEIWDSEIYSKETTLYFASNSNTSVIANNCNLVAHDSIADITNKPIDSSATLKCNNCYYFYNNIYKPLNSAGQYAQGDGNLSLDDTAGNQYLTTGKRNTTIGVSAGSNIYAGEDNTLVGYSSAIFLKDGSNCSFFGSKSGPINTVGYSNGVGNSAFGAATLNNLSNGSYNTAIGFSTASALTNGNNNIITGFNGADSLTTGNNNIISGRAVAGNLIDGNANIITGDNAAANLQHGDNNILIGSNVAANSTINAAYSNAVIIGTNAGFSNDADELIAIGLNAGADNASAGTRNIFIGSNAGTHNTTGNDNTIIGQYSGQSQTTADKTTIIGALNMGGYQGSGDMTVIGANNVPLSGSAVNKSVIMGVDNAPLLANGSNIIILGNNNASEFVGSNSVIILGSNALVKNQSNSSYIVIGNDSANAHISGEAIIVGHQAGIKSKGEKLMVMGHQAGSGVDGKLNTYIGYKSGFLYNSNSTQVDKSGDYNLFIGPYTGFNVSTGSRNVVVGSGDISSTTGFLITSGSGNTILGYGSGSKLTTSDNNTLIGSNVAPELNNGSGNLIFGHSAGNNLTAGTNNIIVGYEAESAPGVTGIDNVIAIGYRAGYNNREDNQIFIGTQAGYNTTDGFENIYIGKQTGFNAGSADYNIFIGSESGYNAKDSNNTKNVCIGYRAGYGKNNGNFTSANNILIGNEAGHDINALGDNIMIGNKAGHDNSYGNFNIFMGTNSGSESKTKYSILIGNSDGNNKGIGYKSEGDNLISIGLNAGQENTVGSENINIGHNAGKNNTAGTQNIIIGTNAGENSTTGDDNIKIGTNSGNNADSVNGVILIGSSAGKNLGGNGNETIAIGLNAGENTNTAGSIYIGTDSGTQTTTGFDNINIGYNSAKSNQTGSRNVAIGPYTLQNCASNINNVIAIGSNAASNIKSNNCIMIGTYSGANNTTGTESIYIGTNSGIGNTVSSYNIGIGNNTLSRLNANTGSKGADIAIGHNAGSNIGSALNTGTNNSNASPFNNTIIGYSALSQGDISSNNIVFGSRAAEFVNNPAEFANNIITGAGAATHSNNAVNSIIIGANTNSVGSGGQYNILIGANSGQQVGNPNEAYYSLKDATLTTNANFANLAVAFNIAAAHIKYGSGILFTDRYAWFSSNVVALHSIDTGANTQVIFDTRLPTNYSFTPSNNNSTQVAITSNIYDKYGFGRNDVSIAGESIIIGANSGNGLTSGSKNTSVGAQTMTNNEIGKYNNIFGARAGYYVKTDNNTCIGTQAGASIDYFLDTNENTKYTASNYLFESNTNSISSTTQAFSVFEQGTVFDVIDSVSNDGRYNISTVTSNSTANIIIVEGYPKIQDDGLTNTIPSGALRLTPGPFKFIDETITSSNIDFGVTVPVSVTGSVITINSYVANTNLESAKIIKVSGSKYNDGIYYVYLTDSSTSGKLKIYLYGFANKETVGNTITIKSVSIESITTTYITDIYNYDLIPYNAPFYVYFDKYKGQYKKNSLSAIISPSSIYTNGVELNDTNINWTTSLRNDNTIYINGQGYYNNNLYNYTTGGSRLVTIYDSSVNFFASNNNIVFSSNIDTNIMSSSGNYSVANTYFKIKGTLNNNIIVKIINISGNVINCDSATSILTDETYTASSSPLILDRDNIYVSGANNILSSGKIFALSQYYKSNNVVSAQPYNFINDSLNGMYITDDANSNIIKATSNYQKSLTNSGVTPYSWSYADTNWLQTNTSASYICSPTISFQTAEISGINIDISIDISTPASNSTITANIATTRDFRDIIAPVMIRLSGTPTNDGYYLIDRNPYPFRTLYLHRESAAISGVSAAAVTANISVNSISNYAQNSNIAATLLPSTEYTVIGSRYNNEVKFTTGTSQTISPYSAYVTGTLSNDSWDGNNLNYLPISGTYTNLFSANNNFFFGIQGSFKNIEITVGGDANNNVQFISSSSTIIITTDDVTKKSCLDQFLSQDYFRTYRDLSSNNRLYRILTKSVSSGTTSIYTFTVDYVGADEYDINNIYSIRMNEFRSTDTKYTVKNSPTTTLDFQPLYKYIGTANFKYLNLSIETSEYVNSPLTSATKSYSSHNYSVDYNPTASSYDINPYPTAYTPSVTYFVVSFIETCTTNYYDDPTNTIYNIAFSSGIPTLYTNQYYTNASVYPNNNIKPIGYTSMFEGNTNNMSFKLRQTGTSNEPYYDMSANIEINATSKYIGLSNITIIQNQIKEPTDIYGNPYNPYTNPFGGLVKGVIYNITSSISGVDNDHSFIFDGVNSSNSYQIYYKDTPYSSGGNLPPLSSYYVSNIGIEFKNIGGILNERINLSNIGGATSSETSQTLFLSKYESTYPIFPTNTSNNLTGLFDNSNASSAFLPVTSNATICDLTYISQGFNTLIFKSSDITNTSQTHLYFSNISVQNASLTFNNTSHTITSTAPTTSNLAVFNTSQYIQLSNVSLGFTEYYLISAVTSPTASVIVIDPNYSSALLPNTSGIYTVKTHTINSGEIATDDLSVFNPGQKVIVSRTTNNNKAFVIEKATYNNPYSLYIENVVASSITTETPTFCTIERSVITDEISATSVELLQIGEPLSGTVNSQLVKYHYEDAEGNNLMIGSFAGNYCGRLAQSIYNTYIGAKVGQVNHGSGNIFLGNESGFAGNELEGATYYSNKFAIYKNNSVGISTFPLIGGDFVSNRVGINTIDPDTYVTATISETDTKLVINGRARAYAFSSFTGVHDITLKSGAGLTNLQKKLIPGMIVISTGSVQKSNIINTIVECDLPSRDNDKRVYGVFVGNSDRNIYSAASVGEGCIWVCNSAGDIENGDYITSCGAYPGYGMRQTDDLMHSYTVAKATEDIIWDANILGVQYALIACTYHCG